jgi:antitoxin HicB
VLRYSVRLSKDTNDTILVEAPDVPGGHTFGEDRDEALFRASDAIASALMLYIDLRRDIPMPRAGRRGPFVTLPALTEAKLALRHNSRLDQLEAAFRALGKGITVDVSPAA